jgi:ATP-dependent RNA helicase MSS116
VTSPQSTMGKHGKFRRQSEGAPQHQRGLVDKMKAFIKKKKPTHTVTPNPLSRTSSTTRAHLTAAAFASLELSPSTMRAVKEVLGYENMTLVQEATLPTALTGRDVIAKAKTGTGKTIGFLLPTIERLVRDGTASGSAGGHRGILALAISPTRELASQIREEAEQLITFHKPAFSTLVVVGGTNVHADAKKLSSRPPTLLVATPGRLNDLLANHGATPLFGGLRTLIFDEADQLLEMGFRPAIELILKALKPSASTRQTLLFSATLPKDVLGVAQFATRDATLIDTVGDEETQTNVHVEQTVTTTTLAAQGAELLGLLRTLSREPGGYKVVVFVSAARFLRQSGTRAPSLSPALKRTEEGSALLRKAEEG